MRTDSTRRRCHGLWTIAAGLLCSTTAIASEPAIDGYRDYRAHHAEMRSIARSELATFTSLGRTLGGREIGLLSIGTGKLDEKPAVLIVGGVVPSHLAGSELALRLARRLTDQAQADKDARAMLDRVTFYVIPRPAPDACEAFFHAPYSPRDGNQRPTDDDRDGQIDEDGPDDLDGDGWITQMRVADPTGRYMAHPDDPRVLIEADPKQDEQGQWSLYTEGRDNDEDEQHDEDGPGGVAFNRNFTHNYPYFGQGAGPHQVSEIETRAVADFAFSHPNIAAVISFTPEDNLMKPPKAGSSSERIQTGLQPDDAPYLEFVAEQYREIHGGEKAPESPDGEGSFSDWAYYHYGRWSFACRGWWIPQVEPEKDDVDENGEEEDAEEEEEPEEESDETRGRQDVNALRWFEREGIDGFVPWRSIDHPDFPGRKVEVGGFKPFLRLNPPAKELDALAEKHYQFIDRLVELFPKLAIDELKAESLGEGVWRIDATVLNRGYLPTVSSMGQTSRKPHPLQIQIKLPASGELVTGHVRTRLPTLSGNGGKAKQTWLVRLPKGKPATIRVRTWSPSVGAATKQLKLTDK